MNRTLARILPCSTANQGAAQHSRMTDKPLTWTAVAWRIEGATDRPNEVRIEACAQLTGPDLYAVRRHGYCLNHMAEWEYEPQPSSRDDAFMARCRFASRDDAANAYAHHLASKQQPTTPDVQAARRQDEREAA